MKNSKIPEIRFSEFNDSWVEFKVKDIINVIDGDRGKNYPSGNDLLEMGHTAFLNASNITNHGFSFKKVQYISELKSNLMGNGKVKIGDTIITSRGTVGNLVYYNDMISNELPYARINSGMLILRPNNSVFPGFIAIYLNSDIGQKRIKNIIFGSAQPQLTKKDISNFKLSIPSLDEQIRMTKLLDELEKVISLLQQELETLKLMKQGFLQKMFPKAGDKVPKVRFAEFQGDWILHELGSLVDRVKSYSLSRDVETTIPTDYKYIHYGDIHTKVARLINDSSHLPNIKDGNYQLLAKGDIILADASEDYQGIATPAVITTDLPYKLVAGLHTIALRPKATLVDPIFLYYMFYSSDFRKYGYKTGTGMKVFGISITNVLKYQSVFPSLKEQIKIGEFFKQLDKTIELHEKELEALKETKKAFLQKMFV